MKRAAQFLKVSSENFIRSVGEEFPQFTEEEIGFTSLCRFRSVRPEAARGMIFLPPFRSGWSRVNPLRFPRESVPG